MSMTVTYRFQEVKRSRTDKFKCVCGKRFQRTVSSTQTVNPYNRNAAGVPKTYAEIWRELGDRLDAKKSDPTCPGCEKPGQIVVPRVHGKAKES